MSEIRDAAANSAYVSKKFSHLNRSDTIAPPTERAPDELDQVIEGVIDALPAANRLYPDLYAWLLTDAVREHLAGQAPHHRSSTPERGVPVDDNSTPDDEPVFVGTPPQWWENAAPVTNAEAAERQFGDWYIQIDNHTGNASQSYRVSTPTLASNLSRKAGLKKAIERGAVTAEATSEYVRKLIHVENPPPAWLEAELVIADREPGSALRTPWRRANSRRWHLLSDARISINEKRMSELNPKPASITEDAD